MVEIEIFEKPPTSRICMYTLCLPCTSSYASIKVENKTFKLIDDSNVITQENNNNNKLCQLTCQLSMLEHKKRAIPACDSFKLTKDVKWME